MAASLRPLRAGLSTPRRKPGFWVKESTLGSRYLQHCGEDSED